MAATPLLILAATLFVVSFVWERVLIVLSARRRRTASERPEPIVIGSGRPSGQLAGYVGESTIHRGSQPGHPDART
jgi:hypothetical protein